MSAEDPTTPLGFEFSLMAADPIVVALKGVLLARYKVQGMRGLDPRGYDGKIPEVLCLGDPLERLAHYPNNETGTHFFVAHLSGERTLMFFLTKQELETG